MKYEFTATCARCKRDYTRPLTKYEAAFFDNLPLDRSCPHCGGTASASGHPIPDIDLELLEIWYKEGLSFMAQDEDLILAPTKLPILRAFMGSDRDKAAAIAEVLAVKFYEDEFDTAAERQWTATWLIENQDLWRRHVWDYIEKRADPASVGGPAPAGVTTRGRAVFEPGSRTNRPRGNGSRLKCDPFNPCSETRPNSTRAPAQAGPSTGHGWGIRRSFWCAYSGSRKT